MPISYVNANGLRFAFLEEGEGPLVLLLHGFPDTAHTFDEVRPALARAGYRAVSPFMRGYAPTAIPADGRYDSDTLGADALALIDTLAGPGEESAILVGHDWGASAAYSAASLSPERLRLLVTIAVPHPGSVIPTPPLVWRARHMLRFQRRSAEALVRADDYAHVDELLRRWSPAWQVPPHETDAVKQAFSQPGVLEAALGYYRAMTLLLPRSQRSPISVPTVTFCGLSDGVLRPADFDRARRCFRKGYEVVRMPGGHFLHREHPARFIEELLRVVSEAGQPERQKSLSSK